MTGRIPWRSDRCLFCWSCPVFLSSGRSLEEGPHTDWECETSGETRPADCWYPWTDSAMKTILQSLQSAVWPVVWAWLSVSRSPCLTVGPGKSAAGSLAQTPPSGPDASEPRNYQWLPPSPSNPPAGSGLYFLQNRARWTEAIEMWAPRDYLALLWFSSVSVWNPCISPSPPSEFWK